MERSNDRKPNELREISFEPNINIHAEGSVLVSFGNTKVICTATIENSVPRWLRGSDEGWVTAEYGMLPRSTNERMGREAARGKQSGRTQEIQRLIGRSLRQAVNLKYIKGKTPAAIDLVPLLLDMSNWAMTHASGSEEPIVLPSNMERPQSQFSKELTDRLRSLHLDPISANACPT